MKLTVLSDNNTIIDRYLTGEPAVSYFIECGGKRILFDTGYSDVYIRNAAQLGIDLTDIELYPCHCTCFEARAAINSRVPVHEIGSGEVLEWK